MTCHVATNHSSSPHVTSQPSTLLHLTPQATSWHQNRSHHHHGTAEGSFTAKKWFGHRAGRSPCAHSIGKFFLWLIVLFLWNFRPRLVRALLVCIVYIICVVHHSGFKNWQRSQNDACENFAKQCGKRRLPSNCSMSRGCLHSAELLSWFNKWVVFLTVLQRGLASHNSVSDWAAKRGLHNGKHKRFRLRVVWQAANHGDMVLNPHTTWCEKVSHSHWCT